jgi:hypothetical protein
VLQPLLSRLHSGHKHGEMAFEVWILEALLVQKYSLTSAKVQILTHPQLRVLEALLLTLITHHSEGVERCLADKTNIRVLVYYIIFVYKYHL